MTVVFPEARQLVQDLLGFLTETFDEGLVITVC